VDLEATLFIHPRVTIAEPRLLIDVRRPRVDEVAAEFAPRHGW
jgi:hypothetical protein